MKVLGLVFAGTATVRREETSRFFREVLGLEPQADAGADADFFALPDGSTVAVAGPREAGEESRTIGFLVEGLDEAVAVLGDAVDGPVQETERFRYAHFHAPDGKLYELVERLGDP